MTPSRISAREMFRMVQVENALTRRDMQSKFEGIEGEFVQLRDQFQELLLFLRKLHPELAPVPVETRIAL